MNELVAYIDESGNTGDVAGVGAFEDQSTFALVALLEPAGSGLAASVLAELRASHRLQGAELKSRTFRERPTLLTDLVVRLKDAGLTPFVELMDKRYFIANNIVTYVLGKGWFDMSSRVVVAMANDLAEVVANDLGDDVLRAYARFAKAPDKATCDEFLRHLRRSIRAALMSAQDGDPTRFEILVFAEAASANAVDVAQSRGFVCTQFVQPPDESVMKNRLALLPQVQAIWNLCARLNSFSAGAVKVRLLHDEQKEFMHILRDYFSRLTSNALREDLEGFVKNEQAPSVDWNFGPGKFELTFVDSRDHAGIQLADVVGGFCSRRLNQVVDEGCADPRFDEAAHRLAGIAEPAGVNFVTTHRRIRGFLPPA